MSVISGTVGAVMGAEATTEAAQTSASATKEAAQMQVDLQEKALKSQQEMMSPYGKIGAQGLAELYGQDVQYYDPTMQQATKAQIEAANLDPSKTWYKNAQGGYQETPTITYKGTGGLYNLMQDPYTGETMQMPSYEQEYTQKLGQYEEDPGVKAQRALDTKRLSQLEQQRYGYSTPGASTARSAELGQKYDVLGYDKYKQQLKDRYTALQGEFAAKRAMTADKYDQLTQQANMGLGVTKTLGSSGQNFANQAGQAVSQAAAANAAAALQAGQAQAGLWSGLGKASASTASAGLKAYDYGKSQGWWGNPASTQTPYATDPYGNSTMGPWAAEGGSSGAATKALEGT